MAENTQTPEPTESDEKKPGFLTRFRTNHPRATKAVLITIGLLGAGAVGAAVMRNAADDNSLDSETQEPAELATDALSEA